jgi:hypothetical protein
MERRYVYYRVPLAQLADAVAAVKAVQTRWQALHPAARLELLRRPELREGQVTLMEVLQLPAAVLDQAEAEAAAAVAPFLAGPRHVEVFEPL